MKKEYDFINAKQGKFYITPENMELPIYLESDILKYLKEKLLNQKNKSIQILVNELLRKDIDIINTLN